MSKILRTAFLPVLIAAAVAALAVPAHADNHAGRYSMSETEDGFLRLDRETGAVSHCRAKGTDWACEAVPDDRTAYEDEIARLMAELEEMRARVSARLEDAQNELPTDEEIDNVFSTFEKFTERFARAARAFRDEMQKLDEQLSEGESGS